MNIELAELIVDRALESGEHSDVSVRHDYSGRSMYGKQTVGIVGLSIAEVLTIVLSAIHHEDDEFLDQIINDHIVPKLREDSMGLSTIVY